VFVRFDIVVVIFKSVALCTVECGGGKVECEVK